MKEVDRSAKRSSSAEINNSPDNSINAISPLANSGDRRKDEILGQKKALVVPWSPRTMKLPVRRGSVSH